MGLIGFAIGSSKDGVDYQMGNVDNFSSWENIREIAEAIWNEDKNRKITISKETHQGVLNRLKEFQPIIPNRPVDLQGQQARDLTIPLTTTSLEFGGFSIIIGGYIIIFRYNEKANSIEQMIDEFDTIFLIEFIMRSKINDASKEIIPQRTPRRGVQAFMQPMGRKVFFNFWNHTFDPDIKERFVASYRT